MEITPTSDPTIVTFEPDKEQLYTKLFEQQKMSILTSRIKDAQERLGMNNEKAGRVTARGGSTDDILPFTVSKKYSKMFRRTKLHHIYEYHTPGYWDAQMKEVEELAAESAKEIVAAIKPVPATEPGDARVEIGENSGIVVR